jgi:hypothetical protein
MKKLIPPEILEPPRRQRRIASRILDIAVPQVGLERPGIDPVVCQLEAAGMPQHVGVRLDTQLGDDGGSLDHAIEPRRRQRRPALGYEHKRRWRAAALVPAELAQFPAGQGMRCWRAAFEPVDVDLAPVEVDLLPLQIGAGCPAPPRSAARSLRDVGALARAGLRFSVGSAATFLLSHF